MSQLDVVLVPRRLAEYLHDTLIEDARNVRKGLLTPENEARLEAQAEALERDAKLVLAILAEDQLEPFERLLAIWKMTSRVQVRNPERDRLRQIHTEAAVGILAFRSQIDAADSGNSESRSD